MAIDQLKSLPEKDCGRHRCRKTTRSLGPSLLLTTRSVLCPLAGKGVVQSFLTRLYESITITVRIAPKVLCKIKYHTPSPSPTMTYENRSKESEKRLIREPRGEKEREALLSH